MPVTFDVCFPSPSCAAEWAATAASTPWTTLVKKPTVAYSSAEAACDRANQQDAESALRLYLRGWCVKRQRHWRFKTASWFGVHSNTSILPKWDVERQEQLARARCKARRSARAWRQQRLRHRHLFSIGFHEPGQKSPAERRPWSRTRPEEDAAPACAARKPGSAAANLDGLRPSGRVGRVHKPGSAGAIGRDVREHVAESCEQAACFACNYALCPGYCDYCGVACGQCACWEHVAESCEQAACFACNYACCPGYCEYCGDVACGECACWDASEFGEEFAADDAAQAASPPANWLAEMPTFPGDLPAVDTGRTRSRTRTRPVAPAVPATPSAEASSPPSAASSGASPWIHVEGDEAVAQ